MHINAVFIQISFDYPKALEGLTLSTSRPRGAGDLKWKRIRKGYYEAKGPRGGICAIAYNKRSNKITISRKAQ